VIGCGTSWLDHVGVEACILSGVMAEVEEAKGITEAEVISGAVGHLLCLLPGCSLDITLLGKWVGTEGA